MTLVIVVFIALGWAGWFWAWGRDRYRSGNGLGVGLGAPLGSVVPAPPRGASGLLAAPRTAASARRRRREVLAALASASVLSFWIASKWSPFSAVTVILVMAFGLFAWATYQLEAPTNASGAPAPRRSPFMPVIDEDYRLPQRQLR